MRTLNKRFGNTVIPQVDLYVKHDDAVDRITFHKDSHILTSEINEYVAFYDQRVN